jgi:3-methyl-2-oxobutanoate hydroxymethyltransferase
VIGTVKRIVESGIPVMGHLGLTPQSIHDFGTYQVRARDDDEANQLREDAKALEEAGCFALVLEKIPTELATEVTESLSIPTIGIGAGGETDGQVLVSHDALGLSTDFNPRFVRRYAELEDRIGDAISSYVQDVRSRSFPSDDESY